MFTAQLEKSREQTDAANLRSAYAVAAAAVLESESGVSAGPVALKQTGNWDHISTGEKIGPVDFSSIPTTGPLYVNVSADGTVGFAASASYTVDDPVPGAK